MTIKRITEEETKSYSKLDPDSFRKPNGYNMSDVVAFTLTPHPEKDDWEIITYYARKNYKKSNKKRSL